MRRRAAPLAAALLAVCGLRAAEGDLLWIEGEQPSGGRTYPHSWYSEAVDRDQLSGNAWASSFTDQGDTELTYAVTVPKDGTWTLWVRANPIQARLSWRLAGGEWKPIDQGGAVDSVNIASDGKPDLRFVAWTRVEAVPLAAGRTTIAFRFHSDNHHHGALDCFVLAATPFHPNGKRKPGERSGGGEPGWFAFEPDPDAFAATALLDLRGLNETRAGEKGSIAVKDDAFVRGDGSPIRFWAVNAGAPADRDQMDYLARRLAKTGVNLTRIHGADLEHVPYAVKAYADAGIYVALSTYFPLWRTIEAADGIEGAALGKHPFCLLFFEPRFQQWYKDRVRALLTTRNPHTGRTLAEDPAVAFFEIQNEDSFFFWTFTPDNLGQGPWGRLEQRFAQWLATTYGSTAKATAAWAGEHHANDRADRIGLYGAWEMTGDGWRQAGPGKQARIADQIRFLAGLQRDFYAGMRRFLKDELKFNGLVIASNWTTADNRRLGGIERWSYAAAADVVDRHGYFGGTHEGDQAGWSVRAGHTYADRAAPLDPASTPVGYLQIAGRPHIHSETAWNKPNRFNADGPLLLGSYAALQGIDGYFLFATDNGNWAGTGSGKWPMMMPSTLGQFPATALQYRRGDVQAAPTVVREVVTTADVLGLRASGVIEGQNVDFRVAIAPKAGEAGGAGFDPLSYCVGRAERVISDLPGAPAGARPVAIDLVRHIDRKAKTVVSVTGQLRWDWGKGIVTVASPASQAVTGFLAKAGRVQLGDVTIESRNEYGTVHVISLDGAPLATAKRILVQAFSEERMSGWRATAGRIEDVGHAPILVREIDATVTFAKGAGLTATVLDGHGYPAGAAAIEGGRLVLPKDQLYTLVTR